MINIQEQKRFRGAHIKIYPEELRTIVNNFLEHRKVEQLAWSGLDTEERTEARD
jgi:hypothetical protein